MMPSTGMKMMARIQAIAADGFRLAEINTAATNTIRTWAASSSQLDQGTDCDTLLSSPSSRTYWIQLDLSQTWSSTYIVCRLPRVS